MNRFSKENWNKKAQSTNADKEQARKLLNQARVHLIDAAHALNDADKVALLDLDYFEVVEPINNLIKLVEASLKRINR